MDKIKFIEIVLTAISALVSAVKAIIKLIGCILKFNNETDECVN